jgi:hypothetical protein
MLHFPVYELLFILLCTLDIIDLTSFSLFYSSALCSSFCVYASLSRCLSQPSLQSPLLWRL